MHQDIDDDKLFLDLDKIFKKKNPSLYKIIPGFILNYLKRIIHQDELNMIIDNYKHLHGLSFVDAVIKYFEIETIIIGEDNIPESGRFIFASNHPIGSIDGMILMQQVGKFFGETKSVVNDLLLSIENMRSLFVGINKHGSNTREGIEEIDNVFSSDLQILFFPAGLASRKSNKRIVDLDWKKTFIARAIKYKRDIIPVHISGKLSNFFYNFANLRKALKIKANLEMLYLSDETFKQKRKKFIVTFGKPISYEIFDSSKNMHEWAQIVKEHVYKIKDDKNAGFLTDN